MQRNALRASIPPYRAANGPGLVGVMAGAMKARFTIAVFDGVAGLRIALCELQERGFARRQFGIVLRASILDAARMAMRGGASGGDDGEVAALLADVVTAPMLVDGAAVAITSNSMWQVLNAVGRGAKDELFAATWMTSQLRSELARYIRNGAIVLGVVADTLDQQRQSTRTLLAHSSHRVQTHEFRI